MIEKYQYAAIILTALVGIYGTFFDFKKNNKITIHALGALTLLIALCIITLTFENKKYETERIASDKSKEQADQANKQLQRTLKVVQESSVTLEDAINALKELKVESQKATTALRDLLEPLENIGFSFAVKYPNVKQIFPVYGQFIETLATNCVGPEISFPPEYCDSIIPGDKLVTKVINGREIKFNDDDYNYAYFFDDSHAFKTSLGLISELLNSDPIESLEDEYVDWLDIIKNESNSEDYKYRPVDASISFNFLKENINFRKGPKGRGDLNKRMYSELSFTKSYEQPKNTRINVIDSQYNINILYEFSTDTLILEFHFIPLDIVKDNEEIRSKYNLVEPGTEKKRLLYVKAHLPYNPQFHYMKVHYGLGGTKYHFIAGNKFIELNGNIHEGQFTDNRWVAVIDEQLLK